MSTVSSVQETTANVVSDRELVTRAQAGDRAAFEELVRRHEHKLRRLAQYLCHGNVEDGEETSQNALLNAYRHLGGFRGESQFSTWLQQIVINECRMYQRRLRRLPRGLNLDDQLGEEGNISMELVDGSDDPEEQSAREEFQAMLRHCLAEMKDLYRTPFVLSQMEGLSNEEMAERLGVPIRTAKTRLLRARRSLRRTLAKNFCRRGRCYWPGAGPTNGSRVRGGTRARSCSPSS